MPEERAATGIAVLAAWERTSEREEPRARTAFMAQKKEEKEEEGDVGKSSSGRVNQTEQVFELQLLVLLQIYYL